MIFTNRPRNFLRAGISTLIALFISLLFLPLFSGIPSVGAISSGVVVSQVYGGGGNAGATLKNDFIELFNRGTVAVDVTGWSVQYAATTGTSWQKTDLAGSIAPGQYYLIQQAPGMGGTVDLPTPNATGTIGMGGMAGKVALVNNNTTIVSGTSCPTGSTIVDFVGYGSATNCSEGTPTANLSNTTAALRNGSGCTETDNNSTDFTTSGAPTPRNSASPTVSCNVTPPANAVPTITAPADPITTVDQDAAPFTVNLSGNDDKGIYNWSATPGTGVSSVTVSAGQGTNSVTYQVTLTSSFNGIASFTATLSDGVNPAVNQTVNIRVLGSSYTPIAQIQGASRTRAIGGTVNTEGVVTAIRLNPVSSKGFFLQDPTGDGDEATSEALFVFTGGASAPPPPVTVGQRVRVIGTASDFNDMTQVSATNFANIIDRGAGAAITPIIITIDPARVGPNIRKVPSVIYDSSTGGAYNPTVNALDFYESLEGMLVQVDGPLKVVGPTNAFGEFLVVPDNGVGVSFNARGGVPINPPANEFNPERIMIDDGVVGAGNSPNVIVKDVITGSIVGPLDFNFSNFKIDTLTVIPPSAIVKGNLAQEVLNPVTNPAQIRVASYNVENLDPADPDAKFTQIATQIVTNLKSPDIIVVEEVQDNNGPTNDAEVSADLTLTKLRDRIVSLGGPTYAFRYVNPVDDRDGGEPGGNIRQAFFFRTDRGLTFSDRPVPSSTTANSVQPDGSLLYNPGRIDPTNTAFNSSRKPLAGEFFFKGQRLIIIGNHFNSKGGDGALYGTTQPPVLSSEVQRLQQATIVRNFVNQLQAADPNVRVIVNGDLNDFETSPVLNTLKTGPSAAQNLNNVLETIPLLADRYTYVFDGNSQSLDHLLYSQSLSGNLVEGNAVHVNADFFVGSAERASDHDPVVAVFEFDITSPTTVATPNTAPNSNGWYRQNVTITLTATDASGGVTTGVKSITYSATGAQVIAPTTVNGATATVVISAEGETTLSFFATDKAGNVETPAKTLTIKLDKTAPEFNLYFDTTTRKLILKTVDGLSGPDTSPIILPVNTVNNPAPYVLKDKAGNSLTVSFRRITSNNGNTFAGVEFKKLVYDSVNNSATLNLDTPYRENSFRVEFAQESGQPLTNVNQSFQLDKAFNVLANFNARKNQTNITIKQTGQPNQTRTDTGFTLLQAVSNNGKLEFRLGA